MEEKKIYLIDGNALLYRAFYAIKRLSAPGGFPTNAIYGFLNMLRKLQEKEKPRYLGIVFDTPGPTVRHEAYEEYKAHRKPMPEDMEVQIPVLKKILKAMKIPVLEFANYEADDVLGSLARKAASKNLRAVIVSTDKDLLQLVDEKTTVYNPAKEIHLDRQKVEEEFGVPPSRVTDVLALWGDPSDNVPGVPGIGEKTSKALIRQFDSLDELIARLDEIPKPRLREKINAHMDQLRLSRKLVTIEKDLDVPFRIEDFAVSSPEEALIPLFQELGFSSLLKDLLENRKQATQSSRVILTHEQLQELVREIQATRQVSVDTETDSRLPTRARLVGMSFAVRPGEAAYLPLRHDLPGAPPQIPVDEALRLLKPVLEDPEIKKIGQNIKYDAIVLRKEGVELSGIEMDTMVLSYLLEPNWGKHSLDRLALAYLQTRTIPYEDVVGKGRNQRKMNEVAIERVAPYACEDADLALKLSQKLWPMVREKGLDALYRTIELPLIHVLTDMEMWGVKIDTRALEDLSQELQEWMDRLQKKIFAISGEEFNINSPSQLAEVLFEKLGLPAMRRTKKTRGYSTSMHVLEDLAPNHPIAAHALEYRQLAKLKSTYADALPLLIHPETGRIHTSYNQTVAATGRLSSSDPNLQNIPARGEWGPRFRKAFIPEPGHLFLCADYSQIELRVLAHLSEDPLLIDTFLNGRDIHAETASQVFGDSSLLFPEEQRRRAKIINFSIIYGATAFSLARELGSDPAEAQKFIDLYYEKYPGVKRFLERSVKEASERGFALTLFGRKRQVPELRHADKTSQQAGRRIALNTPIQGTAADLMKKAMIDIWKDLRKRRLNTKMILQVHDELVFEVPKNEVDEVEALVRDRMENVFPLKAPLEVHLGWGANWAEAK
ncbi:MAG: DNA polymerase I [Candidatus Aminicenantales bacterium]